MNSKLSIQQAAQILGVAAKTLRRWEKNGLLIPARTNGGQRRYSQGQLKDFKKPKRSYTDIPPQLASDPVADISHSQYLNSVLASPILPSQKTVLAVVLSIFIVAATGVTLLKSKSIIQSARFLTSLPGRSQTALPSSVVAINPGSVLAAESVNPEYVIKTNIPAIFTKDITAPNIIYSISAGTGISITSGQTPTISTTDQTAGLNIFDTFKVGTTTLTASGKNDSFTFAAGDNVALTLDTTNKKLTIAADSADPTSAGWTDDGTNVRLTTSSDTVTIGSSLIISDGGLLDLSAILHDDSSPQGFKLPQNTTLTNISSGEGFLAYDSDDNLVKVYDGSTWANISGASTTLQQAYDNDTDGTDVIVALTSADDSLILRNPASGGTDSGYVLGIEQLGSGAGIDMNSSTIVNIGNTGTDFSALGGLTLADDLAINGGDLTTSATTFNLVASANTLNLTGGSGSSGCTLDGTTGNLTCSGTAEITGFKLTTSPGNGFALISDGVGIGSWTDLSTNGTAGPWTLSGSTLYPDLTTNNVLVGSVTTADDIGKLTVFGAKTGKALVVLNETGDQNILTGSASGVTQFTFSRTGDLTLVGDAAVNGGDLTTTQTTATLFNTTATTLSLGGAATTALNIGNGSGAYTAINLGSGSGTHTINVAGTGATSADTINIGTGGTAADTINLGSSASTTALNLTSGTGSQTFASSVVSGTTSTSAFVFTANALTTGTGEYLNSSSLSTGTLFSDYSTSSVLTTGKLGYFNWEPSAAATASGDLVGINIGNGGFTSGNLFNITNVGSSLFSVNPTQIVSSIPQAFNAAGDVSMAYDLQFTNQTASFIKSSASLYLQAGEAFESNNLNLQTFGSGGVVVSTLNALTTTSATSYALQILPAFTSKTNSMAHTMYGTYNFPTINDTGTGVAISTLYGNYTGLNKVAGTITTWYGNYIAAPTGAATLTNTYALVTEASAGNVGIGTTSPIAKLHVTDSSTATASAFIANTSTSAGIAGLAIKLSSTTLDTTSRFINFLDKDGVNIGKVNAVNTTTIAFTGNGTDMAEYFVKKDGEAFESGDIVSISNDNLTKSIVAYDPKIIGVVSTAPSFVGGIEGDTKVLVAIAGQVPIKIDPSSPPIVKGDFVSSSTIAGRATKATRAGYVIGRALEDWTPGAAEKILIYESNIWADPTSQLVFDDAGNLNIPGTLTADDTKINTLTESVNDRLTVINSQFSNLDNQIASLSAQLASLQLQGDPAATLSSQLWAYATDSGKLVTTLPVQTSDLAVIGKLTVGLLSFDDLDASISSLTGTVTVNGDLAVTGKIQVLGSSIGQATLPLGATEIQVESGSVSTNSAIFVTANEAVPVPLSVTDSTPGASFKVQISSPQIKDVPFKWWIVN